MALLKLPLCISGDRIMQNWICELTYFFYLLNSGSKSKNVLESKFLKEIDNQIDAEKSDH